MKEPKKLNSSDMTEKSIANAGVAPKAEEIVSTLVKDSKVLTSKSKSTEKILPSQDVLSLVSTLDVQIYNLTRLLEAKKMEVSLLENNLETVKTIKEKLVGGF